MWSNVHRVGSAWVMIIIIKKKLSKDKCHVTCLLMLMPLEEAMIISSMSQKISLYFYGS